MAAEAASAVEAHVNLSNEIEKGTCCGFPFFMSYLLRSMVKLMRSPNEFRYSEAGKVAKIALASSATSFIFLLAYESPPVDLTKLMTSLTLLESSDSFLIN